VTHPGDPARAAAEAARESAEAATAKAAAERLTFFSDAVVAIAITLLAIELPAPEGADPAELWHSLVEHSDALIAFLISFAVIGNHWMTHHRVFRYVHRADGRVLQQNLVWLLVIVLQPFLTRVIYEGPGELNVLQFGIYAGAQALLMITMSTMIFQIGRRGWFEPSAPPSLAQRGYLRSLYAALGFLLSIPAFLLIDRYAFIIWALVPMVLGRLTLAFQQRDD
jgi:uncharacterized membrane protein